MNHAPAADPPAPPPKRFRKAANGAGSVDRRSGIWWTRVSVPEVGAGAGKIARRKRVPIPNSEKMTEAEAKKEAARLSADVRAGRIVFDPQPGEPISVTAVMTVRDLGDAWTSGQLFERYGAVNKLRIKAGAYIDKVTLEAHVYEVRPRGAKGPKFGDLPVSQVTADDVCAIMGAQPKDHRAETRIKQFNRLHRLFDLAEFPCRLRGDGSNPVKRYLRPAPEAEKLFCFLYPSELLALLACASIPIGRRVLYALAVYTGQRKGSLFALRWKHVDFDHGTLASFKTKTGRAQYFKADPGLMAILKRWREHQGEVPDDDHIVTEESIVYEAKRLATALRDDLTLAKVTRAILFEDNAENVEALRFHDLRSTFCTWARRAGKSDAWISERTGHDVTGSMISRYDRGAQTLADLEYVPFPDIAAAIPELAAIALAKPLAHDDRGGSKSTETDPADDDVTPPCASSGGSGPVDTVGVVGSIPIAPTTRQRKPGCFVLVDPSPRRGPLSGGRGRGRGPGGRPFVA